MSSLQPQPVIRISAGRRSPGGSLRELWAFRDTLFLLVRRDIHVRYSQTIVGAGWALLQPLLSMLTLTVVFRLWVGVSSEGVPYPLFAASGLVLWTFFTHALTQATNSLSGQRTLITHVYFPRFILPLAAVLAGALDLLIGAAILPFLMLGFGVLPRASFLLIPLFILLLFLLSLACGTILAVINVEFRDAANGLPFLLHLWFFATPVAYSPSVIPAAWRPLAWANPLTGILGGFRWALLGTRPEGLAPSLAISVAVTLALLVCAFLLFQRKEDDFSDVV